MNPADAVQRLRITFGVDGPLMYASVLDMGRLWERLLRRAADNGAGREGRELGDHASQPAGVQQLGQSPAASDACKLLKLYLAENPQAARRAAPVLSVVLPRNRLVSRPTWK